MTVMDSRIYKRGLMQQTVWFSLAAAALVTGCGASTSEPDTMALLQDKFGRSVELVNFIEDHAGGPSCGYVAGPGVAGHQAFLIEGDRVVMFSQDATAFDRCADDFVRPVYADAIVD